MANNFRRKNLSYIFQTYNDKSINQSKVINVSSLKPGNVYIIHDNVRNEYYEGIFEAKLHSSSGYSLHFFINLEKYGYKNFNNIIEEEKLENNLNRINELEKTFAKLIHSTDFNKRYTLYDKDILEKSHLEYHKEVTKPEAESFFPPGLSNTFLSFLYKNKNKTTGGKKKQHKNKTQRKNNKYSIKNKRKTKLNKNKK
jgi:hypothetical protein